ncbi:Putative LOC100865163, partial [Caligus rogercresseyi]
SSGSSCSVHTMDGGVSSLTQKEADAPSKNAEPLRLLTDALETDAECIPSVQIDFFLLDCFTDSESIGSEPEAPRPRPPGDGRLSLEKEM